MAPPVSDVDLLGVARRVAGEARPGEQIEAYAMRTSETDIEVFRGEVESLAVAGVSGDAARRGRSSGAAEMGVSAISATPLPLSFFRRSVVLR